MSSQDPITERQRLEATALVASRVSREEAQMRVRRERIRSVLRDVMLAILVVVVAVLGIRNATEGGRTKAAVIHVAQVNCQQYHDVATIPLESATSGVGLRLIADFRNAYYAYNCQARHGVLPVPDPRLVKYLDPQAR